MTLYFALGVSEAYLRCLLNRKPQSCSQIEYLYTPVCYLIRRIPL